MPDVRAALFFINSLMLEVFFGESLQKVYSALLGEWPPEYMGGVVKNHILQAQPLRNKKVIGLI